MALRSAAAWQDPIAFARLCLVTSELTERGSYLDQVDLVLLLLKLQDLQVAIGYLRTGNQLHVDAGTALGACITLNNLGHEAEAQRIFELAKPLGLLTASELQTQRADTISRVSWTIGPKPQCCFSPSVD